MGVAATAPWAGGTIAAADGSPLVKGTGETSSQGGELLWLAVRAFLVTWGTMFVLLVLLIMFGALVDPSVCIVC